MKNRVFYLSIICACVFMFGPSMSAGGDNTQAWVLEKAIEHLRPLSFEKTIILDAHGCTVLYETQHNPYNVSLTDEQIETLRTHHDLVAIHNHIEDAPPSEQDILSAMALDWAQIVVVTPSQTYTITRPKDGWMTTDELYDAINRNFDLFDVDKSELLVSINTEYHGLASEYRFYTTDEGLTAVFDDLGVQYNQKPAEE